MKPVLTVFVWSRVLGSFLAENSRVFFAFNDLLGSFRKKIFWEVRFRGEEVGMVGVRTGDLAGAVPFRVHCAPVAGGFLRGAGISASVSAEFSKKCV